MDTACVKGHGGPPIRLPPPPPPPLRSMIQLLEFTGSCWGTQPTNRCHKCLFRPSRAQARGEVEWQWALRNHHHTPAGWTTHSKNASLPATRGLLVPPQVSNCTTVFVRKPGNPKKWQAEVVSLGQVCDLALITVKDNAFWSPDLISLTFSDVPDLQVDRIDCLIPSPPPFSSWVSLPSLTSWSTRYPTLARGISAPPSSAVRISCGSNFGSRTLRAILGHGLHLFPQTNGSDCKLGFFLSAAILIAHFTVLLRQSAEVKNARPTVFYHFNNDFAVQAAFEAL